MGIVKNVIINVLNMKIDPSELQETDFIYTYGINSVDALEILINMENEFDIQVEEKDLDTKLIDSLHTLTDYVRGTEELLTLNVTKIVK